MPASCRVKPISAADESTGAAHVERGSGAEQVGGWHRFQAAHRADVAAQCPCAINPQALPAEGVEYRRGIAWSS